MTFNGTSLVSILIIIITLLVIIGLLVWVTRRNDKKPASTQESTQTSTPVKALQSPSVKFSNLPTSPSNVSPSTPPTDSLVMSNSTTGELYSARVTDIIPTGTILPFTGIIAPKGYLLCNGQQVSSTTYSSLREVLGAASKDGLFTVPDLRNRYLVGSGDISLNSTIHDSSLRDIPDHRHHLMEIQQVLNGHTMAMEGNRRSERGINLNKWREISGLKSDGSEDWSMGDTAYGRTLLTGSKALDSKLGDPWPSRFLGDSSSHTSARIDVRPPSVAVNYIIKH
jgi:hypothetical protein